MSESGAVPTVLSIAGSDSGGGAGIQADLKAFARCGVHGATAITALTAQNTVEVTGVLPTPDEFIVEQVRAVAQDIAIDAVKIGMLGTAPIVLAVEEALSLVPASAPIVIDPVMVAESGAVLLDDEAREALVMRLLPRATVITPNLPEARVLAGYDEPDAETLARALQTLGPDVVIVTGGHRDEATDVYFDGETLVRIPGERHPDGAAHGSGCTHSSALAAHLALGFTPLEAARRAKAIAAEAVRDGLRGIGAGPGPVDALGVARRAARTRPEEAQATPEEARIEETEHGKVVKGEGWFVLNLGEAAGTRLTGAGIYCPFEAEDAAFAQYGINVHVLEPGEPNALYHEENVQESVLVLHGECTLIVDDQERTLGAWDFVHFPPGTRHVVVGAGEQPCAVLMVGVRGPDVIARYPVSEVAARYGASAQEDTEDSETAYASWPKDFRTERFPWPPS